MTDNHVYVVFIIAVLVIVVLFTGDPDIHDGLLLRLNNCEDIEVQE